MEASATALIVNAKYTSLHPLGTSRHPSEQSGKAERDCNSGRMIPPLDTNVTPRSTGQRNPAQGELCPRLGAVHQHGRLSTIEARARRCGGDLTCPVAGHRVAYRHSKKATEPGRCLRSLLTLYFTDSLRKFSGLGFGTPTESVVTPETDVIAGYRHATGSPRGSFCRQPDFAESRA